MPLGPGREDNPLLLIEGEFRGTAVNNVRGLWHQKLDGNCASSVRGALCASRVSRSGVAKPCLTGWFPCDPPEDGSINESHRQAVADLSTRHRANAKVDRTTGARLAW
jgi:hypothetical protein